MIKKQKHKLCNKLLIFIALIIFLFSIFEIGVSLASTEVITVVNTEIVSKSDDVDINSINYEKNTITNEVIFHKVGDSITYKIKIKNTDKKDHTIKSITDDNENPYITYEYDNYEGKEIKSKEDIDIKITATYLNELEDISERNQEFSVKFYIDLENANGNKEEIIIKPENKAETGKTDIKNKIIPQTGDNIGIYIVTASLSLIILVVMSRKKRKVQVNGNKSKKSHGKHYKTLSIFLIAILIVPTISKAADNEITAISIKNSIKLMDKIEVSCNILGRTDIIVVGYNEKMRKLEEPSQDGYVFKGWKLEDGTPFNSDMVITEDMKIVADFTADIYDITYNLNGGNVEENPTTYTVASKDIILNKPSKEGYKFKGWTGTDLKGFVKNVTIDEGSTGNRSYVANYEPIEYEVMYHLDGGTVKGNPSEYTIEDDDIELNKPTKEGYVFTGWTGTEVYEETEDVVINKGSKGNREYTANYEPIEYSISYRGLTDEEKDNLKNPTTYNIESNDITLNNPENRKDADGDTTEVFMGWKEKETTSLSTVIERGTVGNKEYTAVWVNKDVEVFKITYNLKGGKLENANKTTYTKFDETFILNNPIKKGYIFKGWTGSNGSVPDDSVKVEKGTRENLNYTANYTPIEYTILFDLKGGTATNEEKYTVESDAIKLNNPVKTGYTFKGWTGTNHEEKTMEVIIPHGTVGNKNYTAHYEANEYEIVYHSNKGRGSMANQKLYYDTQANLDENEFTKPGYNFVGWNTKADGTGKTYEDKELVKNLAEKGEMDLYAQWQADEHTAYTVIYELMNVNGDGYTQEESKTEYGTTDTTVTPEVKTYYGFDTPTAQEIVIKGDGTSKVVYRYTRKKFEFKVTDRSLVNDTTSLDNDYYYKTELTISAKEKLGYTFSKWSNNLTEATTTFEITQNTEIYPVYEANQYTVVFDANGGNGLMNDQELTYDQEENLTKNEYTKLGMRFVSWNTKSDGTGAEYSDEEPVKNLATQGTYKLYAIYEDIAYAQFRSDMKNTMTTLSGGSANITSIKYSSTIPTGVTTQNVGVTGGDLVPIYMWYTDGTIYWNSEDVTPLLTGNRNKLFLSFSNLENIEGIANWDTTGLTSLNETFASCTKLTSLTSLKTWDVSAVTDFNGTFKNTGITSLEGLEDWKTGSAQTLQSIFTSCTSLSNIDALEKWDVSNVRSISGLLQNCSSVTSLSALAKWNTKEVTETIQTFQACTGLTSLQGIERWNMAKNKNMRQMFYQSRNIQSLSPLSDWNTSSVENLQQTFSQLKSLSNLEGLEEWNTSSVKIFSNTFDDCNSVTTLNAISTWNVSNGTKFDAMFYSVRNLTEEGAQTINGWGLSKTAVYTNMFRNVNNKPTFMFDVDGTMTPGTWNSNGTLIVP